MESSAPDLTSRVLRHERAILGGEIALVVLLCWWFVLAGAGIGDGGGMAAMAPPSLNALVVMWWLMMIAMMLPAAMPTILLYARVRGTRGGTSVAPSRIFVLGYLTIWLLFSLVAALVQHLLAGPAMMISGRPVQGVLLITAGVYQLSPLKSACLRQCRSPAQFLSRHWRPRSAGALRLGAVHGAICVGCCWMLMALLFVGGVMNFAWIAALTLLIITEKLLPLGQWLGRAAGVALIVWGISRIAGV